MKLTSLLVAGLMSSTLVYGQAQNAIQGAWEGFSDPEILASGFINKLSTLPLSGALDKGTQGWSGHYWPSNKAGITNRWNSPANETFDYKSPSRDAVMRMSLDQLARLSPAEKMDLYNGNYDYPFKREAAANTSRFSQDWAGICHGWAPASLHHNEPTPKVVTNPDGIQIPFGSSDIKALLSYHYAFYDDSQGGQMGLRCFFGRWMGGVRGCNQDLNAGAFHIVMANRLGLNGEGFMMDRDRYREVWNQPIVGYNSKIIRENLSPDSGAARSTVSEIRVKTEIFYVNESLPTWNVVRGTKDQIIERMEVQYRLELDSNGKIVGGEWESADRPDFLWDKVKTTRYHGLLSNLNSLLDD